MSLGTVSHLASFSPQVLSHLPSKPASALPTGGQLVLWTEVRPSSPHLLLSSTLCLPHPDALVPPTGLTSFLQPLLQSCWGSLPAAMSEVGALAKGMGEGSSVGSVATAGPRTCSESSEWQLASVHDGQSSVTAAPHVLLPTQLSAIIS